MKYEVIDGMFDKIQRENFYRFFSSRSFVLGWEDYLGSTPPEDPRKFLHCHLNEKEIKELNFVPQIQNPRLLEIINGRQPVRHVVNLTFPCDVFVSHDHAGFGDTLIYYANLDWKQSYAGETLLYEKDGKTIIGCVPYSPGRFLWFDEDVPHSLRAPSMAAPTHRITFALFFGKK